MIYRVLQDCGDCAPCEQHCCCADMGFEIVISKSFFSLSPTEACFGLHEVKPKWGDPPACLLALADGRDMTYRFTTTSNFAVEATQDYPNVTAAMLGDAFTRLELVGADHVDDCDNCIVRAELMVLCDDEEIAKCVLCPGEEACDSVEEIPPCSEATDLDAVFSGVSVLCPEDCVCEDAKFTSVTLGAETATTIAAFTWASTTTGTWVGFTYAGSNCNPALETPNSGQLNMLITCEDGVYTVSVYYGAIECGLVFQGSGILGEGIANTIACYGGLVTIEEA